MKTSVCLLTCCIIAFLSFKVKAQQLDPLLINDTTIVPILEETPSFANYNFLYKERLDSLQQRVPLTYNESVQKYIAIYSSRKDQMGKMLGLSDYYFPIFEQALRSLNIPEEIKYLPIIESSMNPHAVSRVGATGMWQFMFSTAKGYGLNMDKYVDERKDPIEASYAAAAYFRDAYAELGDWLLAIAAYNCGRGNVDRAIKKAGSRDFWEIRPFLPLETRNYVPAFIAAIYVMNFSKAHQINRQPSVLSRTTDTIQVGRFVSLPLLAEALGMEEALLCGLNPSYKKKLVNGSAASPKRIIMPRVSVGNYAMVYDVLNNIDHDSPAKVVLASNDDSRLKSKRLTQAKMPVKYHRVSQGQNLSVIAEKYNVEVQDLKVWNKLKDSNLIPGQRLIVSKTGFAATTVGTKPAKEYISYKAEAGSNSASGKI
ncbi:membrane-bound lytic murein transglycosylase D [Pedobacter sp. CG_S7]|uniref:lytic transglycosylase domain-containing protein n=1 Tax=Pedobacter sp. CG_S7 TaxID=3143930 RepID=UPI003396A8BF